MNARQHSNASSTATHHLLWLGRNETFVANRARRLRLLVALARPTAEGLPTIGGASAEKIVSIPHGLIRMVLAFEDTV